MRSLSVILQCLGSLSLTVALPAVLGPLSFSVAEAASGPAAQPSLVPTKKSKIDLTPFAKRKRVRPAPAVPANGPLEKNPYVTLKKRKSPEPMGSPIPKGQRITRKASGKLPAIGEAATLLPAHSFELRVRAAGGHELAFQARDGKHRWDPAQPFAIQILTSWGLSASPAVILDTNAPASLKATPFVLPVTLKVTQPGSALKPVRVVASYVVCGTGSPSACRKATTARTYTPQELGLVAAPKATR